MQSVWGYNRSQAKPPFISFNYLNDNGLHGFCLFFCALFGLSAFDDKIEMSRRMNETLEAMVRAIFKDWFVDFGPTRAKVEGCEPYLAPELWDLFPDALR